MIALVTEGGSVVTGRSQPKVDTERPGVRTMTPAPCVPSSARHVGPCGTSRAAGQPLGGPTRLSLRASPTGGPPASPGTALTAGSFLALESWNVSEFFFAESHEPVALKHESGFVP